MIPLRGLRILFVDDSVFEMRETINSLEDTGASVYPVVDGTEALDYLDSPGVPPPDLIVLDIMMPTGARIKDADEGRTTGIEVYRWIQRKKLRIPIVVSTVVSDSTILDNFRHDPLVEIVDKPYRFEELEGKIQKVLSERGKR
jgi:CheY-like chemotaxis protein